MAVLTPQRLLATGAMSSKYKLQQVGSVETEYDEFFRSPLRHYQSAVLGVSSCSTRFPSTSVRISGVLEGDDIEHQLTIDSATEIPCIAKTLIDYIIMKSFRTYLDWVVERFSFQDSNFTMPATHAKRSLKSQYCSVINHTGEDKRLPKLVAKKYVTPTAHEALQRVSRTARPQKKIR